MTCPSRCMELQLQTNSHIQNTQSFSLFINTIFIKGIIVVGQQWNGIKKRKLLKKVRFITRKQKIENTKCERYSLL